MSKLHTLYSEYHQAIWLDYIDRNLVANGGLKALVLEGIRGVTSNPTIFHRAISQSTEYDDAIRDLIQADHTIDEKTIYQWLTIQDAQMAADILEPVYLSSKGTDGYISLEVSPHLAYETELTVEAARHLWRAVNRPNLMIKVPATIPGLVAIESLIAEGINVNATLLFSVTRYKEVIEAYIQGLSLNSSPEKVASVASFFVSRVDSKVDAALDKIGTAEAKSLKGKAAIANAKMAYQHYKETLTSKLFDDQRRRGARAQRPLWASTSTKNPEYSNILYVEQLIGPESVNTVPPETLEDFHVYGELLNTLEGSIDSAKLLLKTLDSLGIDLQQLMEELEQEGVKKFADSYDQLLSDLKDKRHSVTKEYASA